MHDSDGVADFRSFFASVSPVFLNTGPVRSKQARHEAGRHGMAEVVPVFELSPETPWGCG
jgi:hypothetical protein